MDQHSYRGKELVHAVSVARAEVVDTVVFYILLVQGSQTQWIVRKRYSQFEALHIDLIQLFLDYAELPELPPKKLKLFQSHTAPAFIETRRVLIANYLQRLMCQPKLARSKRFHDFLHTDRIQPTNTRHNSSTDVTPASTPQFAASDTTTATVPFPDAEITSCSIPSTRTQSDHVLYVLECHSANKPADISPWRTMKRFSQFASMDSAMRHSVYQADSSAVRQAKIAALPMLPAKSLRLMQDHGDSNFIEERRVLLEHYLQQIIRVPECARNPHVLEFLGAT